MLIEMKFDSREDHHFLDPEGLLLAESLILLHRAGNNKPMTVPIYKMEYKCVFIIRIHMNPYQKDHGGREEG